MGPALGFAPPPQTSAAAAAAWQGWQASAATASSTPAVNPYALEAKTGDRHTLIFGGFKPDTDRADIEEALRDIVDTYEGVERVAILGKFAQVGKVTFKDSDRMWDFIKVNKGVKFPYLGESRKL